MPLIRLRINSSEAKSGPPLAPILGQHQINLMEFCKTFNSQSSKLYTPGTPVRLNIVKSQGQALKYIFKPIFFYSFLKNFIIYGGALSITQLYDIVLIRTIEMKNLNYSYAKEFKIFSAKSLFGLLNSTRVKIKL